MTEENIVGSQTVMEEETSEYCGVVKKMNLVSSIKRNLVVLSKMENGKG